MFVFRQIPSNPSLFSNHRIRFTAYGQNIGTAFVPNRLQVSGENWGDDVKADVTRRYMTGRLILNVRLTAQWEGSRSPVFSMTMGFLTLRDG
jgi:hypothetical protein